MKSIVVALCGAVLLLLAGALVPAGLAGAAVQPEDLRPAKEGHTQILTLEDGSTLNGTVVEVTGADVTFQSSVGKMTIAVDRIKQIREVPVGDIRGGAYWFPNPNRTRLYLGPTARMTPKGSGSLSSVYLFFPAVTYGITNNISIAGGMSLFPGLAIDEQLFYFNPKVGAKAAKDLHLAASALVTVIPDWGDDNWDQPKYIGIVFGVATYGTEDKSITAGVGYGYADEDFADKPAVIFGGEYRVARRLSLVSENWVLPEVDPLMISYGLRFFGEGLAVDMAFVNVASEDAIFPGIPYVGFVWNF